MIRLTIDDQEVSVPQGMMIADAAARLGIEIPVYCYHEALGPLGACRMCLVQVEKMPKLAAACTTAVSEGMVVHTRGDAVDKGRKGVLEFLLINHPLDCPVCDKGGECFLQDYTFEYGPPAGRFEEPKIQKVKDGPINEFILIDQERCVLCQRCVRFMDEYVGENQLLLEGRGVETVVTTVDNRPATSQFSGNVIDLCPVGALLSAPYHHKARPWNIEREESICTQCPVGCTTLNTGRDGRVVRVEGRAVPGRSWGWLCDRGRFGYDFQVDPARILDSRVEGQQAAAARATRQVGEWFNQVVARGEQVAFIMGGLHTTEEAHELHRFASEVVGTSRLAISRDVPGYLPRALNGTFEDIDQADQVVLIGTDPYDAVPVVHLRLRERQQRFSGLGLWGVAPRKLTRPTLAVHDLVTHVGQQAQLLAAALQKVVPEAEAVQRLVQNGIPEVGVTDSELRQFGQALVDSAHLTLLWDGMESDVETALVALAAVRGDRPTRVLPSFGPSNWRGFERAGFSAHYEDLVSILEDARDGKIAMLVLWGADLLNEFPDPELVRQAYTKVPFLVAEGLFAPALAESFKAILPGAGPAELYGTYVNMEARLQVATPSVQPPGQARPTRSYVTAWSHFLKKPLSFAEEWDPYDDESGDLVANDGQLPKIEPLQASPSLAGSSMELVMGPLVVENGVPSALLAPRMPKYPARLHPHDAERLNLHQGEKVRISRGSKSLEMGVSIDPGMTAGRIFVPLRLAQGLSQGPVEVARLEEVHTA